VNTKIMKNQVGEKKKKKKRREKLPVCYAAYPNLRDVSELSSSGGGALLQLQTLLTDSDDVPSSWITMSESTRTGLFPLYDTIICGPKSSITYHYTRISCK